MKSVIWEHTGSRGGYKKWSRFKFMLKHPIVYTKRGLYKLYRRIKSIFIKDRMVLFITREWKSKEDLYHLYPNVDE